MSNQSNIVDMFRTGGTPDGAERSTAAVAGGGAGSERTDASAADNIRAWGQDGSPGDPLLHAAANVACLGTSSADYDSLSDADALAGQKTIAKAQHELDTRKAWMAKTLAHRSRWELGQSGLAKRQGFLSPEDLIQKLTGSTKVESRKLVGVGRMLAETEEADAQAAAAAAEAARLLVENPVDPEDDATPLTPPSPPAPAPWHAPISRAVTTGTLSIDAAHALRTGLGDIDTVVTGPLLADALAGLLDEARALNADQLLKRARQTRDALDEAGIRIREQKAWDDRYLHIWTLGTGQVRVDGLFPPEQGEFIKSTFDSLTSPRRGGVRFVDTERAAWARRVREDSRTTAQITCDGFFDLLSAGTTVNPNEMLGGRRPAVQILTTHAPAARPEAPARPGPPAETRMPSHSAEPAEPAGSAGSAGSIVLAVPDEPAHPVESTSTEQHQSFGGTDTASDQNDDCALDAPFLPRFLSGADDILICLPGQPGHGYIEGNNAPVSAETIDRLICDSGTVQISFDELNRPLDVGHEQRLFNRAQRRALAARDGGCRWPGCDRSPAFTEAHHVEHWLRDRGRTDINQGILLCRSHHLLLHNQAWQIFENDGHFWLRPPATIDPGQVLIEMPCMPTAPLRPQPRPT